MSELRPVEPGTVDTGALSIIIGVLTSCVRFVSTPSLKLTAIALMGRLSCHVDDETRLQVCAPCMPLQCDCSLVVLSPSPGPPLPPPHSHHHPPPALCSVPIHVLLTFISVMCMLVMCVGGHASAWCRT